MILNSSVTNESIIYNPFYLYKGFFCYRLFKITLLTLCWSSGSLQILFFNLRVFLLCCHAYHLGKTFILYIFIYLCYNYDISNVKLYKCYRACIENINLCLVSCCVICKYMDIFDNYNFILSVIYVCFSW